jgi:hypothetical protein
MDVKRASANLAGLLALPCKIGELRYVPPHNKQEKTLDQHKLSTTGTRLLITMFDKCLYIKIIN